MSNAVTLLETKKLDTGYSGARGGIISREVELELREGELVSLIGPNGTGKSTLLKTLGGILPALGGEVFVEGKLLSRFDARERARKIAVVLAGRVETGHLTVEKLVALGRFPYTGAFGGFRRVDEETVFWALRVAGADQLWDRYVDELSDGEYQRVMIARALAQQPSVILLDEPAAFLDLMRRVELMHLLKKICRESSASFIIASHDLNMVTSVSDRVWLLDHEGRVHDGAPEDHVLRGTLERIFWSSHVRFDRMSGTFRHVSENEKPLIRFDEEGEREGSGRSEYIRWSRHALERLGFRVVSSEEDGTQYNERQKRNAPQESGEHQSGGVYQESDKHQESGEHQERQEPNSTSKAQGRDLRVVIVWPEKKEGTSGEGGNVEEKTSPYWRLERKTAVSKEKVGEEETFSGIAELSRAVRECMDSSLNTTQK